MKTEITLRTDEKVVKAIPVHTDPQKLLKMPYYACQTRLELELVMLEFGMSK